MQYLLAVARSRVIITEKLYLPGFISCFLNKLTLSALKRILTLFKLSRRYLKHFALGCNSELLYHKYLAVILYCKQAYSAAVRNKLPFCGFPIRQNYIINAHMNYFSIINRGRTDCFFFKIHLYSLPL